DGIRDFHVTGVQTCALPISHIVRIILLEVRATLLSDATAPADLTGAPKEEATWPTKSPPAAGGSSVSPPPSGRWPDPLTSTASRSEERRVGKGCRTRWQCVY